MLQSAFFDIPAKLCSVRSLSTLNVLLSCPWHERTQTLTCLFDTPRYMSDEAAKKLKPLLKEPVVYTWSSGLFVRK